MAKAPGKPALLPWENLLGQNGDASVGDSAAEVLAVQSCDSSLDAFVAHHVGILRHGSEDIAVLNQTEDIINRGGGNVLIRVYNSKEDESIDYESDVVVHTDGKSYTVPAGTQIRLTPGESIYVYQGLYHDFTVEPGTGDVLLGEVSQCNDDNTDNRFNPPMGRFPAIEEDEPPYRLLCNEYPAAK